MSNLIFLIFFGYFLGSIPFGYLITKISGINIQEVGSGNIGATNVFRTLGLKWAALVAALDVFKGMIPVYLATKFLILDWQIALVAITPVLGHIFPVWLSFKGGKGVATIFGVLFIFLGWKIFLIWLIFWLLILAIFKIMSFTNLLMASFLPLILWIASFSLVYFILGIFLFGLIWWTHRENLARIAKNEEPKLSFGKR